MNGTPDGSTWPASTRPARNRPGGVSWPVWCRRPPPTCSTWRPSPRSALAGDGGSGRCRALLDRLAPGVPDDTHPRDLSEGQRLALALALVLVDRPGLLLLDEPTRGLDYPGKEALAAILRELAGDGMAVLVATHDVEFVAQAADDLLIMAEGELVSRGPVRTVVAAVAGLRAAGDQGARAAVADGG